MAAIAGVLVANPITIVPLYTMVIAVGVFVTPQAPPSPLRDPQAVLGGMFDAIAQFDLSAVQAQLRMLTMNDLSTVLMGATVVGVLSGATTYSIALRWVEHRTKRRRVFLHTSDGATHE